MSANGPAIVSLPVPSGSFPVGRTEYCWTDPGREETASPAAGDKRELVVWVWYPAAPKPGASAAPYLPAGWEGAAQFLGFEAGTVRSHAFADPPPASAPATFPVLVFSPAGFPPLLLAAFLEEIASHGYIVVGVNHTFESADTAFPDGRVVPMSTALMQPAFGPFSGEPEETFRARAALADGKAADLRFVLDQLAALDPTTDRLAGRMDLKRLGTFGHSLGGNAALELCRLDHRCRAAANLDGANWTEVGRTGLDRPAMQIFADHTDANLPCEEPSRRAIFPSVEWCRAESAIMIGGWQTVFERGRPGYGVMIRGGGHANFMDVAFLTARPGSPAAEGAKTAQLDPQRFWRIANDYLLAFFGRHLSSADAPLLDGPSAAYPEVVFGPPKEVFTGPPS